jgi:hypothetical protein
MSAEGWKRYRRCGEVCAKQMAHDWTWTTNTGEAMRARAGDWAVLDDAGDERSVAAEVFDSTHVQIGPHRYRRIGTVLARCATGHELIATLEGNVVANEGDWVVRGENAEQWVVPAPQFSNTYEGPLGSDTDEA